MIAPVLKIITDIARFGSEHTLGRVTQLSELARPGAIVVELRDHELGTRERLRHGEALRRITAQRCQRFIVNDRVDLAIALDADGAHLGQRSMSPTEARQLLRPRAWLSAAVHDPAAELDPELDAVSLSPIVAERKNRAALGISALAVLGQRLLAHPRRPALYALGGVSADTAQSCIDAGAQGVAVIGAAFEGDGSRLLTALACLR